MWRLRPVVLAGALWALWTVRRVHSELRDQGLARHALVPPRRLPAGASRGVLGVLTRLSPTCLERALVLQAWLAARGEPRDVVIGVLPTGVGAGDDAAHAWIDGRDPVSAARYLELHRIPPITAG